MSNIPQEVREKMMAMMREAAAEAGEQKLVDHIDAANAATDIQRMMSQLIPSVGTMSNDERAAEIIADVKEYLQLAASGMKSFMEAHVQKYGPEVLDTERLK